MSFQYQEQYHSGILHYPCYQSLFSNDKASAANSSPNLHTSSRFYSSLNSLVMIFTHSNRAKHGNDVDCYDCELPTHVNALGSHRRDISVCMNLGPAIALKVLEHL